MINVLRVSLRGGWGLLAVLLVLCTVGAFAQGGGNIPREFVAGELIVSVPHGTAQATVNTLAASVNATVVRSFGTVDFEQTTDAYQFRIKGVTVPDTDTLKALATLKADPRVKRADPNRYMKKRQATPNDPRFAEQWDKQMINMPQAWTVEKGQSNVVLCIIDDAIDIDHPEFAGRTLTGYNGFSNNNDPRPPAGAVANADHGTHVTGIAIATANNSVGVAGVVWEKVMLLPMRGCDDTGALTNAALMADYAELLKRRQAAPDKQFVLNLSLGGTAASDTPDPNNLSADEQLIMNLAKNGVIVCVAMDNNFQSGNQPGTPDYLAQLTPNILAVSSVGPNGTHAAYSGAQKYVTIAAPGGDSTQGKEVLSTLPVSLGGYGLKQGCSMAAPQVTGAVALLLSVPGVNPQDVKGILTSTARPVQGATVPSNMYGYGVMDVNAALLKIAVSVTILEPDGTGGKAASNPHTPDPIETLRPTIRIHVSQVTPANLVIKLDGITIPKDTPNTSGIFYTIPSSSITVTQKETDGTLTPLNYDVVIQTDLAPGQHTVEVSGTKPGPPDRTVTDLRYITITPHSIPAGRSLVSIPYFQDTDRNGNPLTPDQLLQYYLGTSYRLARWLPDLGRYVFSSSFGITEPGFIPATGAMPRQDSNGTTLYPLGLAFWSDTESAKPILTRGQPKTDQPIVIPLRGTGTAGGVSWAMVGDPFPFDVGFNSVLVDTPEGRLTIQQAAEKGYLLPNLYAYDGDAGYVFRTLPDGVLRAWTGYWVGVTSASNISLVVPPARVSRAAAQPTRAAVGTGGWEVRLSASVRNLRDTYNFIGVSGRAADSYDRSDVPKPPMVSPFVTMGVRHDDWGSRSGLYAQDMQAPGGKKTWDVVVNTDQPDSAVTVTWGAQGTLPRNVKLTIKDETTGQVTDMRTRASLTFNSGTDPAPRRFTVTASTAVNGVMRISNVMVRSAGGRAAGGANVIEFTLAGDATYDVRILNASGGTVSTVGSRAASAGDQRLLWNGKDAAGRSVATGTYLVQIRAISPDGEVVKVIQPFAILR